MNYQPIRALIFSFIAALISLPAHPQGITEAITGGKVYADFRLRFETVDQDNTLKDADALTLRSRVGYETGSYQGVSGVVEFEDSRVVAGVDDYNNALGSNPEYSVVADPETTELDQGYLQYKAGGFSSKLGRQVMTLDNHRFVGHVGWRQDRQTFDAFTVNYMPVEDLVLKYGYIDQRNRIFAEERDINSEDHVFNATYKTPFGAVTGYGYLLEVDNDTDNALDTFGIRFSGSTMAGKSKLHYSAEFASQESETATVDYDADYLLLEGGATIGAITGMFGYEVLGSDNGSYGFATPLATLHKFNGWADQFLATPAEGLVDMYLSAGGKLGGGAWKVVYHDYQADEDSATVDDLGDEIDLVYSKKFAKNYSAGIKYAAYSAGDTKVDTDKLWVWVGAAF